MATTIATIDDYLSGFPSQTRELLQLIRSLIHETVPEAGEKISYGIPTTTIGNTYLLYFAGYKKHVSVYPAPSGPAALDEMLAPYRSGKGTLQFPLDKPLPVELLRKVILRRLELARTKA